MKDIAGDLLRGAIDIHVHSYPEYTLKIPPRLSNFDLVKLMQSAGMKGVALKSQMLPTVAEANLLADLVEDFEVFGGITLNVTAGGLDPVAVQLAGELGGKFVWMPTWSSKNDLSHGRVYLDRMIQYIPKLKERGMDPENGISIFNSSGEVLPVVDEIVRICADNGMVLCSGHLSPEESVQLSARTRKAGVPFVLNHPLSRSVGAGIDQQKKVANNGGYIEHVFVTTMPMHQSLHPRHIAEAIGEVGYRHCILASDAIYHWNPPAPELLHMFVASLLSLGVKEDEIAVMVKENPSKILGLI